MCVFYPSSGDGAMADCGAGTGALELPPPRNPNFLISSLAISWLALSDGWYSSQNTYLLLSLHNVDAGKHVRAGRILPNEQHGESALSNPTKGKNKFIMINADKQVAERGVKFYGV